MTKKETTVSTVEHITSGVCYECEYETLWIYHEKSRYSKKFGIRRGDDEFVRGLLECKTCGQKYEVSEPIYDEATDMKREFVKYNNRDLSYLDYHDELRSFVDKVVEKSSIHRGELGYWLKYDAEVNDELKDQFDNVDRSEENFPHYQ